MQLLAVIGCFSGASRVLGIKELCFEHQSAGIIFGLQEVQSLRTLAEEIVFSNLPKNTTVFTAASTGPLNELYAV